ncbi:hypothetical protein EJB05_49246, partial [Eragrostis curvula]
MYATKPFSLFKSNPEAASMPPPEGRNSGYLVVKGTAEEDGDETSCWGTWRDNRVWELPFPQNRVLVAQFAGEDEADLFVPVPDQPLASNRYYVVVARGSGKGLVRACSREEDVITCFCRCITDVTPRPFDPTDVYQQIEIVRCGRGLFTARAVAADGLPPSTYRHTYWYVHVEEHKNLVLGEARGLDDKLRACQLSATNGRLGASSVAVGRWYCPFYLVKEDGVSPRKQVDRSPFYEVTLEQRWEAHGGGSKKLASKSVFIGGSVEAQQDAAGAGSSRSRHDGAYVWFRAAASGKRIGVYASLWERMRGVELRGGWVDGAGTVTGGSVLVERFTVKRMDRSVVVAFDFLHLSKGKTAIKTCIYNSNVMLGFGFQDFEIFK